ncbi:MAG TPA: hypothetical protein VFY38_14630 [Pseudonocardia sp.]|nr:hypothetical protein [Pseudonocardia sp.]
MTHFGDDIEELADALERSAALIRPGTVRKAAAAREALRDERARLVDIAAQIEDRDPALRTAVQCNIEMIESAIDALVNVGGSDSSTDAPAGETLGIPEGDDEGATRS